ncbi:MAG: hypothetical protein GY934_00565 [Gammaproteobacteria bacterium]|nr:hypothetical protein [Gammaproteobacteria bacterium]
MTETASNSIPLLGDISLQYVQRIEHRQNNGYTQTRIPGLPGELQQNIGRLSHHIFISGTLFGTEASTQLETLQQTAASGEELTFAANIVSALELQKVVITQFRAIESAEYPNTWQYELTLQESPPLPPPAQVQGFGGLDNFGLGDLGFDTDIMDDLADLAGEVAGAVDDALGILDALGNLGDLGSVNGLLKPVDEPVKKSASMGENLTDSLSDLGSAFNT